MSADAVIDPVRAHHHGHGIPPYDTSYGALYFVVAGVRGLVLEGNGVYVRGICGVGNLDAFFSESISGAFSAVRLPSLTRNSQSRIQAIRSIPGLQLLLPLSV